MAEKKQKKQEQQNGIQVVPLPLDKITTSHNPRRPLKKLQAAGIEPMAFVHEYALSPEQEKREHFSKMIEENQPEIVDMARTMTNLLPDAALPEGVEEPEFTVEVETTKLQIQPIIVRYFNDVANRRYGIAAGERRFIALAYIQAKTGKKQNVLALVKKLTVQQAYWIGVEENLQREDMDEVEKGQIFNQWAVENGREDEPAPWTEVARHFGRPYHEVRGRAALAGLSPERLALYRAGEINLTDAINEGLGQSVTRTQPSRKGTRLVPLSFKEIRALFDATPRTNTERLKAFAEVMKVPLNQAIRESDERLELLDQADARQAQEEITGQRPRRTG